MKKKNHELITIAYLFFGLFLCMIVHFAYFQAVESSNVITSPYNKRQDTFADRVIRGDILTGDGTVVATTEVASDGTETRIYPYGRMFAHAVGYASNGKAGAELLGNYQLLTSNAYFAERFWNEVNEEKNMGDQVYTTLDFELQKAAYDALGNRDGAVIAMEPSTGRILAMVSKPDFDPNRIASDWKSISEDSDGVLLNRVTQGKYAPGSVFKIITLLEYYREGNSLDDFSYHCEGKLAENDFSVSCYHGKAHGDLNLEKAFAKSCNGAFVEIGLQLNANQFLQTCDSLLFNQELSLDFPYNKSSFQLTEAADHWTIAQTSIGQGTTEVTPMHMAMLTCAIANGGNLMKPYIIDKVESYQGDAVKKYMPSSEKRLFSPEEAQMLTEYMTAVVETGTASALSGRSYSVAGKTGTAEYSSDKSKSHAWFVGFSNVENPDLVVCVLVEKAGSGSEYAVPIAGKLFDTYYK
ncbi:MAG: peptidoglycan D,D-transpeptidase FtsI family protein [Lachnospiraceae bacterium]